MNNELIPGKLYELLEDVEIRPNIKIVFNYNKVDKGNIIMWMSNGHGSCHSFLYKNNTSCFQWAMQALTCSDFLKLVV